MAKKQSQVKEKGLEEFINLSAPYISIIYRLEATAKELKKYPDKKKVEWVITSDKFPKEVSRGESFLEAMRGFFNSLKKNRKI